MKQQQPHATTAIVYAHGAWAANDDDTLRQKCRQGTYLFAPGALHLTRVSSTRFSRVIRASSIRPADFIHSSALRVYTYCSTLPNHGGQCMYSRCGANMKSAQEFMEEARIAREKRNDLLIHEFFKLPFRRSLGQNKREIVTACCRVHSTKRSPFNRTPPPAGREAAPKRTACGTFDTVCSRTKHKLPLPSQYLLFY